jgi:hypothetical protein
MLDVWKGNEQESILEEKCEGEPVFGRNVMKKV